MSSLVRPSWNRICYRSTVRRETPLPSPYMFHSHRWISAAEQCSVVKNLITEQSLSLEGAVLSISIFNVTPQARNVVVHHEYFSTASVFPTGHFAAEISLPVLPHCVTKNMWQDFLPGPHTSCTLLHGVRMVYLAVLTVHIAYQVSSVAPLRWLLL